MEIALVSITVSTREMEICWVEMQVPTYVESWERVAADDCFDQHHSRIDFVLCNLQSSWLLDRPLSTLTCMMEEPMPCKVADQIIHEVVEAICCQATVVVERSFNNISHPSIQSFPPSQIYFRNTERLSRVLVPRREWSNDWSHSISR